MLFNLVKRFMFITGTNSKDRFNKFKELYLKWVKFVWNITCSSVKKYAKFVIDKRQWLQIIIKNRYHTKNFC